MKKVISISIIVALFCLGCAGVVVGAVQLAQNGGSGYSEKNCNKYLADGDLFHDQACEYVSDIQPTSGENLQLRLKVKHGSAKSADILYTFDYNGVNPVYYTAHMTWEKVDPTGLYDYWIGTVPANGAPYNYKFCVQNNVDKAYYNREGLSSDAAVSTSGDWAVLPDFRTPAWSQGVLWYSVMPESFYNADTLNDKTGVNSGENTDFETPWGGHNSTLGEWFGGDLGGITHKEEYLANALKVGSLFVNPFWVTNHNAGYGCYDFYQIDSALGNDVELLKLVSALHDDELKIMLDAVFEYCNVNNILYNVTQKYPDLVKDAFYNFVQRDEQGNVKESVWSGGLIDFSKQITRETVYTDEQSVMLTYLITFGIDAWRMDVGNTLSGSRAGNWETATEILQDIRPYLKQISEDVLFLSEHADMNQLTDGILDSKWNYDFQKAVLSWCSNTSNASVLATALGDAVFGSYTRGVSNSLYNFLTTHDTKSFYEQIGYDKVSYMSAYLLMMTYVGSPCVYFNEETGSGATKLTDLGTMTNSFYTSMNWDSSTYDYDVYNFIKALATVRNTFADEYRTGGFLNLYSDYADNPDDIYAYARFADDVCVTVLNRNAHSAKDFVLSVDKLNLPDGSKLYDYFSGKEYVVQGQKITLDILPVGTILTSKAVKTDFVATLESLSGANDKTSVHADGNGTFTLDGDGELSSRFVYRPGFNNYQASATAIDLSKDGKFALLIRNGASTLSDAYGVVVGKGTLQQVTVYNGQITYGKTVNYADGSTVTVARNDDNTFVTTVDGVIVEGFTQQLEFDYYIYLGFAPLSGSCRIGFGVESKAEQYASDFDKSLGSQFFVDGEQSAVSVSDGSLNVAFGDKPTFVLTRAHGGDFTVQTTLNYVKSSGFYGLVVYQNKSDYILLGDNNGKIALAHVLNGIVATYADVDLPAGRLTLQLEKTGTHYKALAVTSDGITNVGEYNVNYCETFVGLVNASDQTLQATRFAMGDGESNVKSYLTSGDIDFSSQAYLDSFIELKYIVGKGNGFAYERGYVCQRDLNGDTMYSLVGSARDFTTTFTMVPTKFADDNAYVGYSFDNSATGIADGYTFRVYGDKLTLNSPDGKVLSQKATATACNEKYRFTVRAFGKHVYVYDQNNDMVLSFDNRTTKSGYTAYVSANATYKLGSYNTYKPSGNYALHNGRFYVSQKGGNTKLELSSDNDVNYVSMRDVGLNDVALGFNLQLNRINTIARGYFVLSLGKNVGSYYLDGLSVRFDDRGRVSVYENGEEKVKNQQTTIANISSVYLVVRYIGGKLTIDKIDYNAEQNYNVTMYERILEYTSDGQYNGVMSFYSKNAGIKLNNLRGYAVSGAVDVTGLALYTDIALDEPIPANADVPASDASGNYRNDFATNGSLATLNRYNGQIYIDEGNLVIDGSTTLNWDAGAAIATGRYRNFAAKFRVKVANNLYGGGFAAFEFYKSAPDVNHQGSALTITAWNSGNVGLFVGKDTLTKHGFVATKDADGYVELTVTVQNGTITVASDTQSFTARIADLPNNADLDGGYVSLNAGANTAYFDWFEIKPL